MPLSSCLLAVGLDLDTDRLAQSQSILSLLVPVIVTYERRYGGFYSSHA